MRQQLGHRHQWQQLGNRQDSGTQACFLAFSHEHSDLCLVRWHWEMLSVPRTWRRNSSPSTLRPGEFPEIHEFLHPHEFLHCFDSRILRSSTDWRTSTTWSWRAMWPKSPESRPQIRVHWNFGASNIHSHKKKGFFKTTWSNQVLNGLRKKRVLLNNLEPPSPQSHFLFRCHLNSKFFFEAGWTENKVE